MCDTIILPDGTEIDQLPLPYTSWGAIPEHPLSCLCRFPESSIKKWLAMLYPNSPIAHIPGIGYEVGQPLADKEKEDVNAEMLAHIKFHTIQEE